jgi:hypothetical protein
MTGSLTKHMGAIYNQCPGPTKLCGQGTHETIPPAEPRSPTLSSCSSSQDSFSQPLSPKYAALPELVQSLTSSFHFSPESFREESACSPAPPPHFSFLEHEFLQSLPPQRGESAGLPSSTCSSSPAEDFSQPSLPPPTEARHATYHPHIDGTPCNIDGYDLPPNSPPPPPEECANNDYTPFINQICSFYF